MLNLEAKDLRSLRYRLLALYPTIFTLFLLIGIPIILPYLGHSKISLAIIFILAFSWLIRALKSFVSAIIGYLGLHTHRKVNWYKRFMDLRHKWKELPAPKTLPSSWEEFYLAIFIPIYKEPYNLLNRTLSSIKNSRFPTEKLLIILAVEERGGTEVLKTVQKLKQKYNKVFKDIQFYIHPANIPGELIGSAGPNLAYAAKQFSAYLRRNKISPLNVLALKFDSDTIIKEDFLSALSYKYLTCPNRYKRYFFPITIVYSNNIWKVPFFSRSFWMLLTFILLAENNVHLNKAMSFSTYAFSFKILEDIGYWDTIIGIDDTTFFAQAYIYTNFDFKGCPIYAPVYMDAVEGRTWINTAKSLFKQQIRWGAGAVVAPIILERLIKSQNISFKHKIWRFWHLLELYSLNTTSSFLLAFGTPLISLIASYMSFIISGTLVPTLLSKALGLASYIGFLVTFLYTHIYIQTTPPATIYQKIFYYLRAPIDMIILPFNAILFNMIPYLMAQLQIVLGRYGNFYVVPKHVK